MTEMRQQLFGVSAQTNNSNVSSGFLPSNPVTNPSSHPSSRRPSQEIRISSPTDIEPSSSQSSDSLSSSRRFESGRTSPSGDKVQNTDSLRAIQEHISRVSAATSKLFMTEQEAAVIPQGIENPQFTMSCFQSSLGQAETRFIDLKTDQGNLFGMIDGYRGAAVADEARGEIEKIFPTMLLPNVLENFKTLFAKLNQQLCSKTMSGCRVLLCFIPSKTGEKTNQIFTATLGDARAYLYRRVGDAYKSLPLSPYCDWSGKGENSEARRIDGIADKDKQGGVLKAFGCQVEFSRALGISKLNGYLSREPFITQNGYDPVADTLMLACGSVKKMIPEEQWIAQMGSTLDLTKESEKASVVVIKGAPVINTSVPPPVSSEASPNLFATPHSNGLLSNSRLFNSPSSGSSSISSQVDLSDKFTTPLKTELPISIDSTASSASSSTEIVNPLQIKVEELEGKVKLLETSKEEQEGKIKELESKIEELKKEKPLESPEPTTSNSITADQLKAVKDEAIEEAKNAIGLMSLLTGAWHYCIASIQYFFRYLLGIEQPKDAEKGQSA